MMSNTGFETSASSNAFCKNLAPEINFWTRTKLTKTSKLIWCVHIQCAPIATNTHTRLQINIPQQLAHPQFELLFRLQWSQITKRDSRHQPKQIHWQHCTTHCNHAIDKPNSKPNGWDALVYSNPLIHKIEKKTCVTTAEGGREGGTSAKQSPCMKQTGARMAGKKNLGANAMVTASAQQGPMANKDVTNKFSLNLGRPHLW